jgi:hypothetical protein
VHAGDQLRAARDDDQEHGATAQGMKPHLVALLLTAEDDEGTWH